MPHKRLIHQPTETKERWYFHRANGSVYQTGGDTICEVVGRDAHHELEVGELIAAAPALRDALFDAYRRHVASQHSKGRVCSCSTWKPAVAALTAAGVFEPEDDPEPAHAPHPAAVKEGNHG